MTQRPKQFVEKRREFIATAASGLLLAGCATTGAANAGRPPTAKPDSDEAEVTPGEDLMQEHGVIERVLLIYDEAARRIEHDEQLDLVTITGAAQIVRRFVEDYHEKQEEQFVFPRLQQAARERELIAVLLRQHQRGRELTQEILRKTSSAAGPALAQLLRNFARMYRPHAAREDTVLFPAFREVVGDKAYRELGERFEQNEHAQFGEHGFEATVAEVARLETALGIGDLDKLTAPAVG